MLEAQEAGRAAAAAGALACDVNAACRAPIEGAGLGEYFRHRMGHGIGMNVHERPFLSPEDGTPLEAGNDVHGRAVDHDPRALQRPDRGHHRRRGDGGRMLNSYSNRLVANPPDHRGHSYYRI